MDASTHDQAPQFTLLHLLSQFSASEQMQCPPGDRKASAVQPSKGPLPSPGSTCDDQASWGTMDPLRGTMAPSDTRLERRRGSSWGIEGLLYIFTAARNK